MIYHLRVREHLGGGVFITGVQLFLQGVTRVLGIVLELNERLRRHGFSGV